MLANERLIVGSLLLPEQFVRIFISVSVTAYSTAGLCLNLLILVFLRMVCSMFAFANVTQMDVRVSTDCDGLVHVTCRFLRRFVCVWEAVLGKGNSYETLCGFCQRHSRVGQFSMTCLGTALSRVWLTLVGS